MKTLLCLSLSILLASCSHGEPEKQEGIKYGSRTIPIVRQVPAPGVPEIFPDVTETPVIYYPEARKPEYARPAWKRFLLSISPYGEVGSKHEKLKVRMDGAEIHGRYSDNEIPSMMDLMPETYAVGISGGFKFYDFLTP